ncbi:MAG: thioredoxin family protein [Verrucomicrobiota bacterium]
MNSARCLLALLLVALLSEVPATYAQSPNWDEILGPRQGKPPAPSGYKVQWRTDLYAAMAEAKKENRPLFVTFRCLPCKQCSAFDKEVLEGGTDLDPLLLQFVTVRLTDAKMIDFRIFPMEGYQDLDLSWWGWILSPEGRVLSVYGGRDNVSDATRISKPSLIRTLQSTLAWHADPRREKWNLDLPAPDMTKPKADPTNLPGYATWQKLRPAKESLNSNCIHCHQVADILRTPAIAAKTFDKVKDTQVWPLPENVGLVIERDHGLLVKQVTPNSAAAKAGLQKGDILGAANKHMLFSQADFRGVLHRGPKGAGEFELVWLRNGKAMTGTVEVNDGWRRTALDWRMSISQGVISIGPSFFPLKVPDNKRTQLGIHPKTMAIQPYMGTNTDRVAYKAGLRSNHVVTSVNGMSPDLDGRAFLVWFRMKFNPGDQITMGYRDEAGLPKQAKFTLPMSGE